VSGSGSRVSHEACANGCTSLDEPSIGIDPVGARELRQTVAELVEAGTTVLLTTHYMFEADELCDRIAVIADGRIVAEGTPEQLKAGVAEGTVVEIEVFGSAEQAIPTVRNVPGVAGALVEERGQAQVLVVRALPGRDVTAGVLGCLTGTPLGRIATREPTLEDAYVELVGHGEPVEQ
jgi:ABC-2 type transport system ATP-binding protein